MFIKYLLRIKNGILLNAGPRCSPWPRYELTLASYNAQKNIYEIQWYLRYAKWFFFIIIITLLNYSLMLTMCMVCTVFLFFLSIYSMIVFTFIRFMWSVGLLVEFFFFLRLFLCCWVGPYCMLDGDVRSHPGARGLCQHTGIKKISLEILNDSWWQLSNFYTHYLNGQPSTFQWAVILVSEPVTCQDYHSSSTAPSATCARSLALSPPANTPFPAPRCSFFSIASSSCSPSHSGSCVSSKHLVSPR